MSWPVTTLVVWDPRVFLVLSRGELLSTKAIFWVDVFQLTRIVSQKQGYRSQKARLVDLETFL